MITFPHCKINLGLHVISKREDGFHDIETCFYPVPWTDMLEIIPASKLEFVMTGLAIPGNAEENLCLRAYTKLKEDYKLPNVYIHLHKILQPGAGLGGGSSDAAYTLKLLNHLFGLNLSLTQLMEYASALGSDCTFFLMDKPMIGTGKGDILKPASISLKGKFLLLVKPDVHISTVEAYAGLTPQEPSRSIEKIVDEKLSRWKIMLKNDFEESIFKKYPAIQNLKDKMYELGAAYASMTGSGAAVFGIFEKEPEVPLEFKNLAHWKGFLQE